MIHASKADTVANLQALRPILAQLTKAGDDLPNSLRLLLTFPFPDNAASGAIKGDYANLHATLDLNLGRAAEAERRRPRQGWAVRPAVAADAARAAGSARPADAARTLHPVGPVRRRVGRGQWAVRRTGSAAALRGCSPPSRPVPASSAGQSGGGAALTRVWYAEQRVAVAAVGRVSG